MVGPVQKINLSPPVVDQAERRVAMNGWFSVPISEALQSRAPPREPLGLTAALLRTTFGPLDLAFTFTSAF